MNSPRNVLTVGAMLAIDGPRSLSTIAHDIGLHWSPVYFGAVPYLEAMATMATIDEDYMYDSGRSVVLYFLSNARTWKGEHARRIKSELKALLEAR